MFHTEINKFSSSNIMFLRIFVRSAKLTEAVFLKKWWRLLKNFRVSDETSLPLTKQNPSAKHSIPISSTSHTFQFRQNPLLFLRFQPDICFVANINISFVA
ncbi:hypothetical protein HanRHA438_Chr01g0020341 [Helianthus annuus]|uniref:Uncharacterized protein n=1 Tax=Helianthus annuus TaxID=4232 RepID=A0A9K3P240_HELAN|nr:hypothetical protein HanXRQr2_Chr01g0019761 [Helianthus annuus]KAJ0622516.1 hypothetical protein HanIR_Chr01g0021581 [Helianthus annuus]KAJ0947823.1 hypothetical protein HanRHA438_Chr01g0020341 [Helianthus annuus]